MKMTCPHCGLDGTAVVAFYGKKVRCPGCREVFRVTEEIVVDFSNETNLGKCSMCGFRLSMDFIKIVDGRPVCMACAD